MTITNKEKVDIRLTSLFLIYLFLWPLLSVAMVFIMAALLSQIFGLFRSASYPDHFTVAELLNILIGHFVAFAITPVLFILNSKRVVLQKSGVIILAFAGLVAAYFQLTLRGFAASLRYIDCGSLCMTPALTRMDNTYFYATLAVLMALYIGFLIYLIWRYNKSSLHRTASLQ